MKAAARTIVEQVINGTGLGKLAHRAIRQRPLILMYHGLTENPDTLDWTQVRAADFERQMQYMKDHFAMVSLADIVAMLETGTITPHLATVTFDDGYQSNYTLALPVLKRLNIPATIFVTSGFVNGYDTRCGFLWPDYITALLKSHTTASLDFTDIGLGPLDISTPQSLSRTRSIISEHLKTFPADKKDESLACMERRHGGPIRAEAFPDYRPLQLAQLRLLADEPLITIGAHSISHQILSRMPVEKLEAEIGGSKIEIEKLIGRPVQYFAYPNGRLIDINAAVVEIAARHFEAAVTTEDGFNRAGQGKYLLRRIGIGRNFSMNRFEAIVSGIYHLGQKPLTL